MALAAPSIVASTTSANIHRPPTATSSIAPWRAARTARWTCSTSSPSSTPSEASPHPAPQAPAIHPLKPHSTPLDPSSPPPSPPPRPRGSPSPSDQPIHESSPSTSTQPTKPTGNRSGTDRFRVPIEESLQATALMCISELQFRYYRRFTPTTAAHETLPHSRDRESPASHATLWPVSFFVGR